MENTKDEVNFLPADKCQMFPQIDIIILGVCVKACPNYPKRQNSNFSECLYNISKKKLEREEVVFFACI